MNPTPGRLVLATGNRHKVRELSELLRGLPLDVRCLTDYPDIEAADEDGETFELNAVKKAAHTALSTGEIALADDSGLEVDALGDRPGIQSARYAATNEERIERVLREMSGVELERRTARFVCVMALADPRGYVITRRGTCEGLIAEAPSGKGGFGYDPIFYVPRPKRTLAQLTPDEKHAISHRGAALRAIADAISTVVMDGKDIRACGDFEPRTN